MTRDHAPPTTGLSYRDAGVDIDAGNRLVERIKPLAARTARPEVPVGLGGFGGLFELPLERYRRPVLVSGTDGVGTKVRLALDTDHLDEVGIDLVAMCVNDIVVLGAEPLFFLDYYATGRLDVDAATRVIAGIARGCEQAGAALIGGETAEMPGMYHGADFDLAGFAVGVVEKEAIIDGRGVEPGDALIGIASSGPHSNGYSLIRKIIERSGVDLATPLDGRPLVAHLMAPTRIYVKPLLALIARVPVRSLAHITGGGLVENVPRVLPSGCRARIDVHGWPRPAIFDWLQDQGGIAPSEMYRTFNCGIGMVVCVPADQADQAVAALAQAGEQAWVIGDIVAAAPGTPPVVEIVG